MDEFLEGSEYTDVESQIIQKAARVITRNAADKRDEAIALFRWVQDHSRYALGLFAHKASETLLEAYGSCTNKANLFIALSRSRGMPAAFRIMVVDAKEYLGPPAIPRLKKLLGNKSLHVYAAIHLNGRWLDVDPSDDVRLTLAGEHVWPQVRRVTFDGESDARLNLDPDHIMQLPMEYIPHIDDIFRKRPTKGLEIITTFNDYTDFMRRRLVLYESCEHVFDEFLEWYKISHPDRYDAFHAAEDAYLSALNGAAS